MVRKDVRRVALAISQMEDGILELGGTMVSIGAAGYLPFAALFARGEPLQVALVVLCLISVGISVLLFRGLIRFKLENKALRALVYDRPDIGVAQFRFQRMVEHCNPTLERMFGMSREDIIGKSLPLPECRRPQWEDLEARLRSGFSFWDVETVRVRGDGSHFRAYISGIPIFGRDRCVVGYLGMIREERWAQDREAEALRFAALADNSSDFLLLLGPDLRIIYANPTVAAMTGIDFDLIDGISVLECFSEDDRDSARRYFEDFLLSRRHDEYSPTLKLRHRDTGVEAIVEFAIYPIFESPGDGPAVIACVARDRSNEMTLAQQLRMSHKEIQVVFEHTPVGIVILDPNWISAASNRAFQELMGYASGEIRGLPFAHFVHPDDLLEARRRGVELAEGRINFSDVFVRLVHKDGAAIPTRIRVAMLRHDRGSSNYAIGIIVPTNDPDVRDDDTARPVASR